MKTCVVPFLALTLAAPVLAADDLSQRAAAAREAVNAMQTELQKELQDALEAGGPVKAIGVCKTKAPAIAAAVSKEKGMKVSRTSLNLRNPANKPDSWERTVLKLFEMRRKNGENPATIEYYEALTTDRGKEFRYMKAIAIPAKAPCLTCHGKKIDPQVRRKLRELYPRDQATGYRTGDLRGAFVVHQPM